MDKHTPGPWNVNTTKVDGAIVRWHIASDKHGSVYPVCEHVIECEPSGAEQLANASLIAAAPELLAACKRAAYLMAELAEQPPHIIAARTKLVEAIKKADPAYYGSQP